MTDVQIREARPGDADHLARVYRSAYRENRELGFPAAAGSATASLVDDWIREHRVFVATVADRVVGGVRLERTGPGRVKLARLGVHDDRKGEGIGSALLAHAEDAARDRGAEVAWLTTPPAHPSLPDFYRRRGYERTGAYPLDDREYDEIVMEKRLD